MMKRILIHSFLTLTLAVALGLLNQWYTVIIAAAISSYVVRLKGVWLFLAPFIVIGLDWAIEAYLIGAANDFTLATKIAKLFPLGGSSAALILLTGVLGGIFAGAGSLVGRSLKALSQ
ncbi:MAG: hypothetical protein ACO3IX_07260 [Flavobacteriaceae bacterium]